MTRKVLNTYPPIYRPSSNGHELRVLKRQPVGAQGDAILGTTLSLQTQCGTSVVGEMGTGKTFIAAASAYLAGCRRVLVLCPPHLVRKWRREVLDTVPDAEAAIVQSITDLEQVRRSTAPVLFVILSRERAKLSHRWRLWCADRSGPRRFPLADYVKRRMAGFFDLLIGDEVHELKARDPRRGSPPACSLNPPRA